MNPKRHSAWRTSDVEQITSLGYAILATQVTGGVAAVLWIMAALYMSCAAYSRIVRRS